MDAVLSRRGRKSTNMQRWLLALNYGQLSCEMYTINDSLSNVYIIKKASPRDYCYNDQVVGVVVVVVLSSLSFSPR